MGNFGFGEMAVIAIFGLLVFGPQRLPEIARSVGGFIREFKNTTDGITKEFRAEMDAPHKVRPVSQTVPAADPPASSHDSVAPTR